MTSGLRALIERFLPWYDPEHERALDRETERIARRSEEARRVARAAAAYRHADDVRHGEDLIDEVERQS